MIIQCKGHARGVQSTYFPRPLVGLTVLAPPFNRSESLEAPLAEISRCRLLPPHPDHEQTRTPGLASRRPAAILLCGPMRRRLWVAVWVDERC